jgi:hypothetical protein
MILATRRHGEWAMPVMKWPNRMAQGFSPGFVNKRFDLKVSTDCAVTSRWNRIDSMFLTIG